MSADAPVDDELRARVFLRAVLPLVDLIAEHEADRGPIASRAEGSIELSVRDRALFTTLRVHRGGRASVRAERCATADVRWTFRDPRALNELFMGRASLPSITPWGGALSPLVSLRALALLAGLRVLDPKSASRAVNEREKSLRVQLLLSLVTRAMAELHRASWPAARALTVVDRERVFQWSVRGTSVGAWLRVRPDRACAGRGAYLLREPFVHTEFRDVEAAFAALTTSASQMEGFRGGAVVTHGSPEYARKVSHLMQLVDGLLTER